MEKEMQTLIKRTGLPISISDKVYFRAKKITRDKKGTNVTKGSIARKPLKS